MSMENNSVPLEYFFSALERRLRRKFPGEWPSFRVEVYSKLIELRFSSEQDAEMARGSLQRCISRDMRKPDVVFKYWQDDSGKYIGKEAVYGRWRKQTQDGWLSYAEGGGFYGLDAEKNIFYRCRPCKKTPDDLLISHALCDLFYFWSMAEGLALIHGAAIGVNGIGMVISGRSGAGKSTLAISCLLAGMDFVADDLLLLSGKNSLEAIPLYSSVSLNPDMNELLCPDMPLLGIRQKGKQKGKLIMDASGRHFAHKLAICGIIVPAFGQKPMISPIQGNAPLVRILHSSMTQFSDERNTMFVRTIASWLRRLPAFEFKQCEDFRKNAEFLRQFIEKEF